ncbi:MAG: HDOD domain-containing protein [Pseudomonadota bacterium]
MTPQTLAREAGALFSLPQAVLRINELIGSPDHTANQLAEVVELDAGLTARILRLANSAMFGRSGSVDSVTRAVVMIGENALRDLVMATSVTQVFKGIPEEFVDMASFWDNSATCGVVARLLAGRLGIREGERLFVAGLLHGIGHLVFFSRRAEQYREVLKFRDQGEAAVLAEERRIFGFNYAELGAALAAAWQLPAFFQEVIGFQLEPQRSQSYPRECAILHLARDMAASLAPSLKTREAPGDWAAARDALVWQLSDLTPEVLEEVRLEALAQAFEVIDIINPGTATVY